MDNLYASLTQKRSQVPPAEAGQAFGDSIRVLFRPFNNQRRGFFTNIFWGYEGTDWVGIESVNARTVGGNPNWS